MEHLYEKYLRDNKAIRIEAGIVLIPDISGYTNFVNHICIEAGRYITRELLVSILQANNLGLEVSEIEGDAILFYKFGDRPAVQAILDQYEIMLDRFREKLLEIEGIIGYELGLSLKLIAHYGTFSEYTIGNFRKLYGEPIVRAHALLKNTVKSDTYVLMTNDVLTPETARRGLAFRWIDFSARHPV